MKTVFPAPLVLLALLLCGAPALHSQSDDGDAAGEPTPQEFFRQFGDRQLTVRLGNQEAVLLRREGDRLVFQVPNNPRATYSRAIDDENLRLFLPEPDLYRRAVQMAREGNFEEVVRSMRPIAYPLVRYLEVPPEKFNIHNMVQLFLEALIETDRLEEAKAILDRYSFADLPSAYAALGLDLAAKMVEAGEDADALVLIDKALSQVEGGTSRYLPVFLEFAATLRDSEQWTSAENLYTMIQDLGSGDVAKRAEVWLIYITARRAEDNPDLILVAENRLDQLSGVEEGTPVFALQRFVEGKIHAVRGEYREALERLGEAVIYSEVSHLWMSELLYEVGRAYQQTGSVAAARSAHGQNVLFFRDGRWARLSQDQLDALGTG